MDSTATHKDPVAAVSAVARPQAASRESMLFRELVEQHRHRLYRFVLRHIGDATEAEELAQQAFVEAARVHASFRGDSMLSTWLYGIAMNLVRNHLTRAPQRRYQFEDDSAFDDLPGAMPDPEEQCAMSELIRVLDLELEDLMPEMREVLMLVAMDDMSYEDAAALLAVPIGTVRSRVSRARSHLRRGFEARGAVLPF
jgi:RNA polymerase sigma factor (sigma-70 family)